MRIPVTPPPSLPDLSPASSIWSTPSSTLSSTATSPCTSTPTTTVSTRSCSPCPSRQPLPRDSTTDSASPTNLTLPYSDPQSSLPKPRSLLLSLPPELHLEIITHLDNQPISRLALRSTHSLFAALISPSRLRWQKIQLSYRRAQFVTAERSFREGYLQGLWATGLMPCYSCMQLKGKSCFSIDVREGNRGIGKDGFEWRRCVLCGGSDKREARVYLRKIKSVWTTVT